MSIKILINLKTGPKMNFLISCCNDKNVIGQLSQGYNTCFDCCVEEHKGAERPAMKLLSQNTSVSL